MASTTLQVTSLAALRVAQVGTVVNDETGIEVVLPRLLHDVETRLGETGSSRGTRQKIITYYGRPDGSKIEVAAGVVLGLDADIDALVAAGFEVVDLPEEPLAASATYPQTDQVGDAWAALDTALEEQGLRNAHGLHRQLLVLTGGGRTGLQLQCPIENKHAAEER